MAQDNKKLKAAIASIAIGATTAVGALVFNPDSPMTFDEYRAYVKMMNYEIEQSGGKMELTGVKSQKDILKKIYEKIENRPITQPVVIDGVELTVEEYTSLRKSLIDKERK